MTCSGPGALAAVVGKGLLAGLLGTAAMTISSTLEAKLTDRGSSSTPAKAVEEVFDLEPQSEEGEQQLGTAAHWGYGTAWGAARGLLAAVGLGPASASAAHFATVWGGEQVVLPALGVARPTWRYGGQALATDLLHHAVYAVATGVAYEWLDQR